MKTTLCLLLTLGALASTLQAAVVVQFSADAAPADETQIVSPDYVAGRSLDASGLAPSNDSLERLSGSLTYRGWDADVDLNKYIGFTVSAQAGYELNLTHLSFETVGGGGGGDPRISATSSGVTSYVWAYRIDEGNGYSAWTFGQMHSSSETAGIPETWDFADIYTTGTVEFGLFATSNGSGGDLSLGMIRVDGVVPEPATGLLSGLTASLLLFRRRRGNPVIPPCPAPHS